MVVVVVIVVVVVVLPVISANNPAEHIESVTDSESD